MVWNNNIFKKEALTKTAMAALPKGIKYLFKAYYKNANGAECTKNIEVWIRPRKGGGIDAAAEQLKYSFAKTETLLCYEVVDSVIIGEDLNR